MTTPSKQRKPKQSRAVMLRVTQHGTFEPADDMSRELLRKRKFRVGDIVKADPKKARNPHSWSRAHKLAQLLIQNVDEFANSEAHAVLKRIQWEANIECEEMGVQIPGVGYTTIRIPRSLSFADMDEGRFQVVYGQFCQHVIDTYWSGLTHDEINDMAGLVGAAA